MNKPIPLSSGEQVRDQMRDLKDFILTKFEKVDGGALDGFEMMSRDIFMKAWGEWFEDVFEMPQPSEHAAELRTPGRIVLAMECPECREYAPSSARLSTVLTDDGSKRTISLKVSAQKVENHVHGQIPLPDEDEVGTGSFELEDIVTEDDLEKMAPLPAATTHEYIPNRGDDMKELAEGEGDRCLDCGLPQDDSIHAVPGDKGEPTSA